MVEKSGRRPSCASAASDRRLQRFLAGLRERSGAPVEVRDATVDGRVDALARAINAQGHEPIRDPRLESLRARAKEGDRAAKRLRQIESKRWVRVGRRVESSLARLRRVGRRSTES
jgi:hypothetical protein